MGFGDKLKGLKDQAQQAVAENKDKIQGAVQAVGDTANTKTHGKYATKIMKVGETVESHVDKFAEGSSTADTEAAAGAAAGGEATADTAAGSEAPAGAAASEPAAEAPDPAYSIEGDAPQDDCQDAPAAKEPDNPVTPSAADAARAGFPDFDE